MYSSIEGTSTEATTTPFGIITTQRGDIVALLDSDGDIFARYTYTAYGDATTIESYKTSLISKAQAEAIATRQPLRYAGYVYDTYSALYYCSQRYYDAHTLSFISKDPARADGEKSPYLYCDGEPVTWVDETGEYSAKKAVNYALKWWNRRNPKYPNFAKNQEGWGGHDCANFVSQCLYAGGLRSGSGLWKAGKKKKGGYYSTKRWASSNPLKNYLIKGRGSAAITFKGRGKFKTITRKDNKRKFGYISWAKKGDVIFYDTTGDGLSNHTALIRGSSKRYGTTRIQHSNAEKLGDARGTAKNTRNATFWIVRPR